MQAQKIIETVDKLIKKGIDYDAQFNAGPGGFCICPSCGTKVPHVTGQPCIEVECPECRGKMAREIQKDN